VSIDLAVWEGARPSSDKEALQMFESLYELYIESDDPTSPSPAIAGYVAALVERYPDLTAESGDECPWSDGPLIGNASGPFIYFGFVRSATLDDAWAYAVDTARSLGLVSFDPQSERLA
jgi:hypothetical protein